MAFSTRNLLLYFKAFEFLQHPNHSKTYIKDWPTLLMCLGELWKSDAVLAFHENLESDWNLQDCPGVHPWLGQVFLNSTSFSKVKLFSGGTETLSVNLRLSFRASITESGLELKRLYDSLPPYKFPTELTQSVRPFLLFDEAYHEFINEIITLLVAIGRLRPGRSKKPESFLHLDWGVAFSHACSIETVRPIETVTELILSLLEPFGARQRWSQGEVFNPNERFEYATGLCSKQMGRAWETLQWDLEPARALIKRLEKTLPENAAMTAFP